MLPAETVSSMADPSSTHTPGSTHTHTVPLNTPEIITFYITGVPASLHCTVVLPSFYYTG